jgi:hypothetical protein
VQRDVTTSPVKIEVPWEGAFRWRVSARDARGLEGVPSADGLIAVDAPTLAAFRARFVVGGVAERRFQALGSVSADRSVSGASLP